MSINKITLSGTGKLNNVPSKPYVGKGPKYIKFGWHQYIIDTGSEDITTIEMLNSLADPESIEIYLNGLLLLYGTHYNINDKLITFSETLPQDSNVIINANFKRSKDDLKD